MSFVVAFAGVIGGYVLGMGSTYLLYRLGVLDDDDDDDDDVDEMPDSHPVEVALEPARLKVVHGGKVQ